MIAYTEFVSRQWSLYQQFIHHTLINLRPNEQLLSTQQHAYQSFWVTSCFDSVCIRLWHAGWILDKNVNANMNFSYPTTMYKSILVQICEFLVLFTIFAFYHGKLFKPEICTFTFIHWSRITVVHIQVNVFSLNFAQRVKVTQTESNQGVTKK